MNYTRKEINEKLMELRSINSGLKESDIRTRSMILVLFDLQQDLNQNLARVNVKLANVKVCINDYENVKRVLSGEESNEELDSMLNIFSDMVKENVSNLLTEYSSIIKRISDDVDSLQNNFVDTFNQKSYENLKSKMDSYLKFIQETLIPLVKELDAEVKAAEIELGQHLDANFFENLVSILPSDIDLGEPKEKEGVPTPIATPQKLAELSYQGSLSTLKALDKVTAFVQACDKHKGLWDRREDLRKRLREAYSHYKTMVSEMRYITDIFNLMSIKDYFEEYSTVRLKSMNNNYQLIKESTVNEDLEGLKKQIQELDNFLEDQELIWRKS